MAEIAAFLWWNLFAELHLYLEGVLARTQPQLAADADAVGVTDIALLAVDISQKKISGLTAHAGEL